MLDIKFIRENPDLIRQAAQKKRLDFDVDKLIVTDEERRKVLAEAEELRAKQNRASDKVAILENEESKNRRERLEGAQRNSFQKRIRI